MTNTVKCPYCGYELEFDLHRALGDGDVYTVVCEQCSMGVTNEGKLFEVGEAASAMEHPERDNQMLEKLVDVRCSLRHLKYLDKSQRELLEKRIGALTELTVGLGSHYHVTMLFARVVRTSMSYLSLNERTQATAAITGVLESDLKKALSGRAAGSADLSDPEVN